LVFALAMLALGFWVFVRATRTRGAAPVPRTLFVLSAFSLIFMLNASVGRVCLGVGTAASSRYVPYLLPLVFATYVYLDLIQKPAWLVQLKPVALCLFTVVCVAKEVVQSRHLEEVEWYSS